jgi:hypothetical protein
MTQIWLGGSGENEYIAFGNTPGDISDGSHTFNELYDHRHILFCHLALKYRSLAFKTRLNHEKTAWDGWFIAGIDLPNGQVSYHLPNKYWEMLPIKEVWYNENYDNHTSLDVLSRLTDLLFLLQEDTEGCLLACCGDVSCPSGEETIPQD